MVRWLLLSGTPLACYGILHSPFVRVNNLSCLAEAAFEKRYWVVLVPEKVASPMANNAAKWHARQIFKAVEGVDRVLQSGHPPQKTRKTHTSIPIEFVGLVCRSPSMSPWCIEIFMFFRTSNFTALSVLLVSLSACSGSEPNSTAVDDKTSEFGADAENLDADGLPVRTFQVKLPDITTGSEYTIDLSQWDIPNDGTNPDKTTANLQAAIDWAHEQGHTKVTLPAGDYLIGKEGNDVYRGGIEIRENTEFVFSPGAVVEIDTNACIHT